MTIHVSEFPSKGYKITHYLGAQSAHEIHEAIFVGHDSSTPQFHPPAMDQDEDDYNRGIAHQVGAIAEREGLNVWVYERSARGWAGWRTMADHLNYQHDSGVPCHLHNMFHFDDVGKSGVSGVKCMYWHLSRLGKRAAHIFAPHLGGALNLPYVGWDGKGGAALDGTDPRGVWWLVYYCRMTSIISEHACASTRRDALALMRARDDGPDADTDPDLARAHITALQEYIGTL